MTATVVEENFKEVAEEVHNSSTATDNNIEAGMVNTTSCSPSPETIIDNNASPVNSTPSPSSSTNGRAMMTIAIEDRELTATPINIERLSPIQGFEPNSVSPVPSNRGGNSEDLHQIKKSID